MAMTSFAFSVHNFISSVGADAGFAAIVGLAVLVLLYFAHARETANLRQEAALLTERLQHAEATVAELTRQQTAAAAAAPVPPMSRPAPALAPFAPLGTAAPALASATRVVPLATVAKATPAEPPAAVERVPALAVAGAPGSALPLSGSTPPAPPFPPPTAGTRPPAPGAWPAPSPATAAAAGNGAGHASGQSPAARSLLNRPFPPLELPPERRSPRAARVLAVIVTVVVVAVIAVVLFLVTRTSTAIRHSASIHTSSTGVSNPAGSFKPASVTVAVLNGTATNQLAHRVAARLTSAGYREGTVATAANQTETTTVVAYLPGARNRIAALHVASALGLRPSAVRPVDQSTLQVACPGSSSCPANVVVTVGADLAG